MWKRDPLTRSEYHHPEYNEQFPDLLDGVLEFLCRTIRPIAPEFLEENIKVLNLCDGDGTLSRLMAESEYMSCASITSSDINTFPIDESDGINYERGADILKYLSGKVVHGDEFDLITIYHAENIFVSVMGDHETITRSVFENRSLIPFYLAELVSLGGFVSITPTSISRGCDPSLIEMFEAYGFQLHDTGLKGEYLFRKTNKVNLDI